jgi:aminoglycoside/choline kinase family phosphotransferase
MTVPPEASASLDRWIGEGWSASALAGDASVRAYYRVRGGDGTTYILSWYPPEVRDQLQRVVAAYRAVSPHATVPRMIGADEASMLQQDVGDATLFALLYSDREEGVRWYRKSLTLLAYFQRAADPAVNPPFDADFFAAELEMTREFYVERLMGMPADPELGKLFRELSENITRHPYKLCHRDFHGQNIHILKERLYLIDYQDLRMGPDTYDMASLLRDRGVSALIGDDTELDLIDYYRDRAGATGDVRRRYFETLLQRSVKILGTFSKQPITRGRMHYLDFIPPTLVAIRRALGELPEYAALGRLIPMDFDPEKGRAKAERMFHGETQNHAAAG